MKAVTVTDLRQHLSSYLAEVQRGRSITVTSRGRPVAALGPPRPLRTRLPLRGKSSKDRSCVLTAPWTPQWRRMPGRSQGNIVAEIHAILCGFRVQKVLPRRQPDRPPPPGGVGGVGCGAGRGFRRSTDGAAGGGVVGVGVMSCARYSPGSTAASAWQK